MQFALLIYFDESEVFERSPEERLGVLRDCVEHNRDLDVRGFYVSGAPLQPSVTATVMQGEGQALLSDGPFAEDVFWAFHVDGVQSGPALVIPSGAVGADGLLGALSALPGFDNEAVVRAMGSTADAVFIVWRNPAGAASRLAREPGAA